MKKYKLVFSILVVFVLCSSTSFGFNTVWKNELNIGQKDVKNNGNTPTTTVVLLDTLHINDYNKKTSPVPPPVGWESADLGGYGDVWHETTTFGLLPPAIFCAESTTNHYPAGIINYVWIDFDSYDINMLEHLSNPDFDLSGSISYNINVNDSIFPVVKVDNYLITLSLVSYTGDSNEWQFFSFKDFVSTYFGPGVGNDVPNLCAWVANNFGYSVSDVKGIGFVLSDFNIDPTFGLSSGSWSGLLLDNMKLNMLPSANYNSIGPAFIIGRGEGIHDRTTGDFQIIFGTTGRLRVIGLGAGGPSFFHLPPGDLWTRGVLSSPGLLISRQTPIGLIIFGFLTTASSVVGHSYPHSIP